MNNESTSYIYTNWRGKSFIIDEEFARKFRESILEYDPEDEVQLLPEDVADLTPEKIMRELPEWENMERMEQLESMWEKSAS